MICDTFTCDDLKRACRAFFRDNDRECPENFDAHLNEVYAKYRERSYEVFVVSRASSLGAVLTEGPMYKHERGNSSIAPSLGF